MRIQRGDNFRRDIPEAQQFLYPNDDLRISAKEAAGGIGMGVAEALFRGAPFHALAFGGKRLKEVANRPIAYPGMHKRYLDDKYGTGGWDVYQDRNNNEQRNPDFYYNEQDFGNGSTYTQRENKRFAGELLSDEWLEDIKAHGIEQDMLEEMVEQRDQKQRLLDYFGEKELAAYLDPKNPSRTAEQQLAHQLLYEGRTNPSVNSDRILGKDKSLRPGEMGISGEYKGDSEIRGEVQVKFVPDGDGGYFDLERTGVNTEILNPRRIPDIHEDWARAHIVNRKNSPVDTSAFNEAAGEYYGQQGLKMAGARPVSDKDRSGQVLIQKRDEETGAPTRATTGTDRLIEYNRGLDTPPINEYEPADYRYYDQKGRIHNLDYQVGSQEDDLSMNLFKASPFRYGDERELFNLLSKEARALNTTDLDKIMQSLESKGLIGGMTTSQDKAKKSSIDEALFRSGKMTANADYMGQHDSNKRNTAYEGTLYGLTKKANRDKPGGYIPDEFALVQGVDARKQFAQDLLNNKMNGVLYISGDEGKIDYKVSPTRYSSLLSDDQLAIIQEPYSLDEPMAPREPFRAEPILTDLKPSKPGWNPANHKNVKEESIVDLMRLSNEEFYDKYNFNNWGLQ